jgi:hypothetical protein
VPGQAGPWCKMDLSQWIIIVTAIATIFVLAIRWGQRR